MTFFLDQLIAAHKRWCEFLDMYKAEHPSLDQFVEDNEAKIDGDVVKIMVSGEEVWIDKKETIFFTKREIMWGKETYKFVDNNLDEIKPPDPA